VVVAPAAPLSVTVTPDPFAAGLTLPEMVKSGFAGEVSGVSLERPWQPAMAIAMSKTVAVRRVFQRESKASTGEFTCRMEQKRRTSLVISSCISEL
jgi:hypothetical protein